MVYMNRAHEAVHDEFFGNYDYYWLKYSIERGAAEKAERLLAGHSLSRFGVIDRDIPGLINLSFFSQDYYYSFKIVEKALKEIPSLKHVILGTGYISAYMDLSRAQSRNELDRIVRVYGRYFNDIHNMDPSLYQSMRAAAFPDGGMPADGIRENELRAIYDEIKENYFCHERSRQSLLDILWNAPIPEAERFRLAGKRTDYHNRLLSHRESYTENTGILQRLADLCKKKGVSLSMIVFPANRYYRQTLDPGLKEGYMRQLGLIPVEARPLLMDLFASQAFDPVTDFADTDHLNDCGAAKMTAMLKELPDG